MTDTRDTAPDAPGFVDPDAPAGDWLHAERLHRTSWRRWMLVWCGMWAALVTYFGASLLRDPRWDVAGVMLAVTAVMMVVALGSYLAQRRLSGDGWLLLSEREFRPGRLGSMDPASIERIEVLRGLWQQAKLRWQAMGAHRMLVQPGVKAAVRVHQSWQSGVRWDHETYVVGSNHPEELVAALEVARQRGLARAEEDAELDALLAADAELMPWDREQRREALRAQRQAERARWEQLRAEQDGGVRPDHAAGGAVPEGGSVGRHGGPPDGP